jgi:hypothetical protein
MATAQRRGKKRWFAFAALALGFAASWVWFNRAEGPRIQLDPQLALFTIELEEGAGFVRSGWSTDRDRDGLDDLLVLYSPPSRLNLLRTAIEWKRSYQPNRRTMLRLSSKDGAELSSESFLEAENPWLHLAQDGRSCFHLRPNEGALEICSDPTLCCAPDPKVRIELPGQKYEAYIEERGLEIHFVLEDRIENELVLREKLGRFGQLYAWPALREQGRCLLYYGALGSWTEISEVRLREDEQDNRWPISAELFGVSAGQFFPTQATLDANQISQLLAVWESPSERTFLRLALDEELEVEQLGSVPRDVSAVGQLGAPVCALPQGDDFIIVHARAPAASPYPLILDVKLPGLAMQEVALPVDLDTYGFGGISMTRLRAPTPFHGPQQVLLQTIADQDGDQIADWRVLIRVGGCRGGLLVFVELSGATGRVLERRSGASS